MTDFINDLAGDVIDLLDVEGLAVFSRFAQSGGAALRCTGERYQGGNAFALWAARQVKGYASPYFMTFKQALTFGTKADPCCVRKGSKGTRILFFDRKAGVKNEETGKVEGGFSYAKTYVVFSADLIDGLPDRFFPAVAGRPALNPIPAVEAFIANTGARVDCGRHVAQPLYRPTPDQIAMPDRRAYVDEEAFYADHLHELIHWTKGAARTGREGGKRFGDDGYALEELVAEIGSAMLCRDLGISKTPRADHAPYLAHWLKALKADPKLLWTAASAAEKAVDYLNGLQPAAAAVAA